MTVYYDTIEEQYKKITALPYRLIEEYTYFNLLGDLTGKSILDLACGEGLYSRKFLHKGAEKLVGVDISTKMIELAKQQESQKQEGIEYIVGDVMELGKIGSFDLVVASYLLNYARTKEELLKMCQTIYTNLKPSGRFVSINNNLQQCPESYGICEKYGYTKSISETLQEGAPITLTFRTPGDNKTVSFDNYYLSKETYEWAFQTAGFGEIHLHQPIVSPEGIKEFDLEFWQDFLEYAPIVGIECLK